MKAGKRERGSGLQTACQKAAPRAVFLLLSLALAGCTLNRHYISEPGKSQALCVESGDRLFMNLEEDSASGCRWYAKCADTDVGVVIDHEPGKDGDGRVGALGTAEVTIRVNNGYDGPSTVTFVYRQSGKREPIRQFAITLFKRTGHRAVWE